MGKPEQAGLPERMKPCLAFQGGDSDVFLQAHPWSRETPRLSWCSFSWAANDKDLHEDLWPLPLGEGALEGWWRDAAGARLSHWQLGVLCGSVWLFASTLAVGEVMVGEWNLRATLILMHQSYWVESQMQCSSQERYSFKPQEEFWGACCSTDLLGFLTPHWITTYNHYKLQLILSVSFLRLAIERWYRLTVKTLAQDWVQTQY